MSVTAVNRPLPGLGVRVADQSRHRPTRTIASVYPHVLVGGQVRHAAVALSAAPINAPCRPPPARTVRAHGVGAARDAALPAAIPLTRRHSMSSSAVG